MLDSIREIFDILNYEFESVGFNLVKFNNFKELATAIDGGKCPVVDVLKTHYSFDKNGSHVMVATGIKNENGVKYIQLKNSFADNPHEQGKVPIIEERQFLYVLFPLLLNFNKMFITYGIKRA